MRTVYSHLASDNGSQTMEPYNQRLLDARMPSSMRMTSVFRDTLDEAFDDPALIGQHPPLWSSSDVYKIHTRDDMSAIAPAFGVDAAPCLRDRPLHRYEASFINARSAANFATHGFNLGIACFRGSRSVPWCLNCSATAAAGV